MSIKIQTEVNLPTILVHTFLSYLKHGVRSGAQLRRRATSGSSVEISEEGGSISKVACGQTESNPPSSNAPALTAARANCMTENVGTIFYMSPEIASKRKTRLVYDEVRVLNFCLPIHPGFFLFIHTSIIFLSAFIHRHLHLGSIRLQPLLAKYLALPLSTFFSSRKLTYTAWALSSSRCSTAAPTLSWSVSTCSMTSASQILFFRRTGMHRPNQNRLLSLGPFFSTIPPVDRQPQ